MNASVSAAAKARGAEVPALVVPAFLLLWASAFIAVRYAVPYAEPLTLLSLRLGIAVAAIVPAALLMRSPWPRTAAEYAHSVVAGLLNHAVYLGGVFGSIAAGVPTGVVALFVAFHPLLTAAAAGPLLGEQVTRRLWLGLAFGCAGVLLVIVDRSAISGEAIVQGILFALVSLVGLTGGTIYQRRYCTPINPVTGSAVQYMVSAPAVAIVAFATERMHVVWSAELIVSVVWMGAVLSAGTFLIFLWLLKRRGAARASGLFYMVAPITAVAGWLLFDEVLGPVAIAGMAVAIAGVALARR